MIQKQSFPIGDFRSEPLFEIAIVMAASRGRVLLAEVEAMEKKKPLFGKHGHLEKTADKMTQCANAFRAERDFVSSGEMYIRAARLYQSLDDFPSATKAATDSAHMNGKDPTRHTETMDSLHFAIDLYKSKDKAMDAVDLLAELAKVLADENNLDGAVQALQEASEL
jgi:Flp pilus assembly protein TadD